jgi:hypothetical protein
MLLITRLLLLDGTPQRVTRACDERVDRAVFGGGGGSRTRVRKCYWSRAYMLIPVHAPGIRHFYPTQDVRGPRSERTRNANR